MLAFIDRELVDEFIHDLRDRGMTLRLGAKVDRRRAADGRSCLVMLDDGRAVRAEMVLFAAGRDGATDSLDLEACGLDADDRGRLAVDPATFQTSVPHIYAAGDVIGFPSLASTSMEQGRIAACHAFGVPAHAPPEFFPYGIYSVPEISTVGMTEEQVRERGIPYECGIARFRETSRGHIMGLDSGFMKMIFALETRRLLGVHIVGEGATELIHIGQAVLNLGGTLDYFVENTFNYPTLAEAYKIAGARRLEPHGRAGQSGRRTRRIDENMGKRIVFTGGSGKAGRHVVPWLQGQGPRDPQSRPEAARLPGRQHADRRRDRQRPGVQRAVHAFRFDGSRPARGRPRSMRSCISPPCRAC